MQLSQLVFEAQSTGAAGPCAAVNAREGNSVAAQAAARSNIRLLISHNLALTMGAMADGVDACLLKYGKRAAGQSCTCRTHSSKFLRRN
jgi:hypothetical protein